MIYVLTTIHVLVCFFLIIIVLLQSGKAADLAGAFGGMGSQTAFGPRGAATVLSKATTVSAVLFMVTSITMSIYETRRGGATGSVLDRGSSKSAPAKTKRPAPPPAPVQKGQPFQLQVTPQTTGSDPTKPTTINLTPVPVQKAPAAPGQTPAAPTQAPPAPAKK